MPADPPVTSGAIDDRSYTRNPSPWSMFRVVFSRPAREARVGTRAASPAAKHDCANS
jgi:hypothetical protein